MKKDLFIYGAGGLGREVLSMLHGSDLWNPAGFIDDFATPQTVIRGIKILGGLAVLRELPKPVNLLLAFGDPSAKQKLASSVNEIPEILFPTLVHPTAILQDRELIQVGAGSIICAGCILTTEIRIGEHALVNLNCTIGHNTVVGNYSSVMPGVNLAGHVTIGASVFIGSGANVINGIRIGDGSSVGAGAVVTKEVPAGVLVVGIPAKIK